MAKHKNRIKLSQVQRKRLGQDIESLGLTPEHDSVEIRFDVSDPDVKHRIDLLSRYGLVTVRQHESGDRLWRVALTNAGTQVAHQHYRRVNKQRSDPVSLTKDELEKRDDARTKEMAQTGLHNLYQGEIEDVQLPPDPILITTPTLRAFQGKAAERGLSRIITQEVLDKLDPNARHRVTYAWKHTTDDGKYKNIRLRLSIATRNSLVVEVEPRKTETRDVMCDITLKDWDMLMVPHMHKARQAQHMPSASNVLYLTAPRWTATRSFGVVHELHSFFHGCVAAYAKTGWHGPFSVPSGFDKYTTADSSGAVTLRGDEAVEFMTHPRALMNTELTEYLQVAHPIVIDAEWVEIQEEWSQTEAFSYAQRLVLPFDPIYLDFMGEGGRLPEVPITGHGSDVIGKVEMTGCLIYTDRKSGLIAVQPIGGRQVLDPGCLTNAIAGGYPYEQSGRILFGGRCNYGTPFPIEDSQGNNTEMESLWVVPFGYENLASEGVAHDLPTFRQYEEAGAKFVPSDIEADSCPGFVELPMKQEDALVPPKPDETLEDIAQSRLFSWTRVVQSLAVKSLSMLSLIDNEHVELREASLGKTDRKAVQRDRKKGHDHGVASEIVVVRKARYVGGQKVEDHYEVDWSHQWRVRRHEQHHGPHTPAYQAKPWLAKPCGRCGSCRRFLIESYIKGPADKPLKDKKTYMYKE